MKNYIYLILISSYILVNKYLINYSNDLYLYIINPIVWIVLLIIGILFYKNNNFYYHNKNKIMYIIIISLLLYNILFYTLGYFVGYANNIYSTDINGIVINVFSVLLVIIFKNYIRSVFIRANKHNILLIIIITLLIFLSNLNISIFVDSFKENYILTIITYIIPLLITEIFISYISFYGGITVVIIYTALLYAPSLIIPIVPKYEDIIPAFFNILFPIFTYVVIKNNMKIKKVITEEVNPINLLMFFIIAILIMLTSLGTFSFKPSVILSASMMPAFHKGDIILTNTCNINNVEVNDIIKYSMNDYFVVHRVTKIYNTYEGIELVVKGDNNTKEDKLTVTRDNLVGCYFFKIKYLGYPSYLIYSIFNNKEVDIELGE